MAHEVNVVYGRSQVNVGQTHALWFHGWWSESDAYATSATMLAGLSATCVDGEYGLDGRSERSDG